MIRHSMDVVKNAVEHVNPGQTPVVTLDQSLFALAKQIQWKWPEKYGEDKMVVMFGGLHIEMAALKTLGDWLRGSGYKPWCKLRLQRRERPTLSCELPTVPAQEELIKSLHILQHRAYERHPLPESFRLDFEGDVRDSDFSSWQIIHSFQLV